MIGRGVLLVSLIVRRALQLLFLLLGISFLVFSSMYIAPGDPAAVIGGPTATESDITAIRDNLGLNDPFITQYVRYVGNAIQGDFGYSYQTSQPVSDAIMIRFPNTLKLAIASMIVAVILGVITGLVSALKQNSLLDVSATTFALAGISIPNFWLGALLILVFSVNLQWLPVGGMSNPFYTMDGIKELILPAITLGTGSAAMIARMTRSSMLEVIRADYVRTARAKGVKEKNVIWIHTLKNAMIPIITVIGLNFGLLLGGTIITEKVFAINGVGRLMIDAIAARDFPMVQGSVLLVATLFVLVNLIVDIVYTYIDPRIKYE